MYIKSVELSNFRNYEKEKITYSKKTNILYGKNAQGKTNVLEAVSLFASGKSHRRAADKDLIKLGEDTAKIRIEFESEGCEKDAEIIISKGKKKFIKLCGANLRRTSELLGVFGCVVFSPEELSLINGAPELRRNFTDLFLSSYKPLYYSNLKRYNKILKQKNNLLKKADEKTSETLDIWNEEMASAGAKITAYRKKFIKELNPAADKAFYEITNGKEKIEIKYVPSVPCESEDTDEIKNALLSAMNKKKEAEMFLGTSVAGIHRDDFSFFINGENAKIYASQGQQRTAVIALKIAQSEIIKEKNGEYPIFLLDDVMSELDFERRIYLAEKIMDKQVIITCTDKYKAENAKYFKVENGKVTEDGLCI